MQDYWRYFIIGSLAILLLSKCQTSTEYQEAVIEGPRLKAGIWRATVETLGGDLPFQIQISHEKTGIKGFLINGEEKILLDSVAIKEDSIFIPMHIFEAQIRGKITKNNLFIEGIWEKPEVPDYQVPFRAEYDRAYRFAPSAESPNYDLSGRWAVEFSKGNGDTYPAIALFEQSKDGTLTGTFMTKTGDYRYLDGQVNGDTLKLSAFDGEHAFLFKALALQGEALQGDFWSGKGGHYTWIAQRDENASLPDADSLTFLKEGYETLNFRFPNLQGDSISLQDEAYQGKVVIVQIFGSWCPNCMDETAFLSKLHQKYQEKGLEVIGLAFENNPEMAYFQKRMAKLQKRYDIGYEFLLAGTRDKEDAARALPELNQVIAYPTTIFIDKNGKVRKIHTGFTGPGTGKYYEELTRDFRLFVEKLLQETADKS